MAEFIGGYIDKEVNEQLQARSRALADPLKRETLNNEQLFSTAFVNVISSVDETVPEPVLTNSTALYSNRGADNSSNSTAGSTLAKTYVLSGGLYRWDGKNFVRREGINFDQYDTNASYTFNRTYGVRPNPGITSFSIESKGTYGTIRDATIQFPVFSLEELEIMEKLYFRPGFSAIVEWGHTAYLDKNGNLVQSLSSILNKNNQLFEKGKFDAIEDLLKGIKSSTSYNYDSFIGYIKNFSYKFNKQGGYDCSISIISKGELLDSLQANTGASTRVSVGNSDTDKPFSNTTNILTKFVSSFSRTAIFVGGRGSDGKEYIVDRTLYEKSIGDARTNRYNKELNQLKEYIFEQRGQEYLGVAKSAEYTGGGWFGTKYATVYMPMDVLLLLLNYFLKTDVSDTKAPIFHVNQTTRYFKYRTFPDHIVLDPRVAMLPQRPSKQCLKILYPLNNVDVNKEFFLTQDIEDIRNIHISNLFLYKVFNKYTSEALSDQSNFRLMVKEILDGVSNALGGVNEFDLEVDEDTNLIYIVDRTLAAGSNEEPGPAPVLPLTGLVGITTDLVIESKITKELGNKISIAAQGRNTSLNSYIAQYRKWNENLVDRFAISEEDTKNELKTLEQTKKDEAENALQLIKTLKNSYDNLRFKGHLYDEDWDNLPGVGSTLYVKASEIYEASRGNAPKGIIPLELSFTLKGISGFKIGQSFKISPGLLPEKYNDYGFIVTGISNTISSGTWLTTIKAFSYILSDKPSAAEKLKAQTALNDIIPCPETNVEDVPFVSYVPGTYRSTT